MSKIPKGGTELMYNELMGRIDSSILDNVSIFNYPSHADVNKKTVYWNQLSYDQPTVQFLKEVNSIDVIDYFVFVSHWQSEIFRKQFGVPGYKTAVIKNACIGVDKRISGKRDKLKICYTSTPWRGLDILLSAWELINPQNCELHIFSDTKIYGDDFSNSEEQKYEHLYEKAKSLNGVVYRGTIPNEELRMELKEFDILAYPSTFEETSCISVIDALSAGLRVICSNLGALPETTEGWARMYPYLSNRELHINHFANVLMDEIGMMFRGELEDQLHIQSIIYSQKWSWDVRIHEWNRLIKSIDTTVTNSKYFCMIHTKDSKEYTYKALESFFKYTNLSENDRVFLIDNDGSLEYTLDNVSIIRNKEPKSFAENINQILSASIHDKTDFVLLSNDIIFTPNWLTPLVNSNKITVPLCNQYVSDIFDGFQTESTMDISEYIGNEEKLNVIANNIINKNLQFTQPKLIPFYCFYLPHTVSSVVGLFDTNFGKAGGEDIDYRLRAKNNGFETELVSKSYLLHFMGKSTWRGAETEDETIERNTKYQQYFISKWGEDIANEYFTDTII
jgi:glycosyltransferase involved in cell wall biosynthesis/GT2 family glycosyltransferase